MSVSVNPQNDIMLDQGFPLHFDAAHWAKVSALSPNNFKANQTAILKVLLEDMRLFDHYFKRFYNNHMQLKKWETLARENQRAIHPYVFYQILEKPYKHYRNLILDREREEKISRNNELFRTTQHSPKKKDGFHSVQGGGKGFLKSMIHLPRQIQAIKERGAFFVKQHKEMTDQDYHQLFLRTFTACDGFKYIYYDFKKHMSGAQEKYKYNNFIRIRKKGGKENRTVRRSGSQDEIMTSCHTEYLHTKEEEFEDVPYSKFSVWAVGQNKMRPRVVRQQAVFGKMPHYFKKMRNPNSKSTHAFKRRIC